MTSLIKKCPKCGRYTMRNICETCGVRTSVAHPHKYSPDDKWRHLKAKILKEIEIKINLMEL